MLDYSKSRSDFEEMLDVYSRRGIRYLQHALSFFTTKGLVSQDADFYSEASFKLARLKVPNYIALCIASWHIEDECLSFLLREKLEEMDLQEHNYLKVLLSSKFAMIQFLWESNFRTNFILSILYDIEQNTKERLKVKKPQYLQDLPEPKELRRIGIGYKDQGHEKRAHEVFISPSDGRKQQYLLEVKRKMMKKSNSDFSQFLFGAADLYGSFV